MQQAHYMGGVLNKLRFPAHPSLRPALVKYPYNDEDRFSNLANLGLRPTLPPVPWDM